MKRINTLILVAILGTFSTYAQYPYTNQSNSSQLINNTYIFNVMYKDRSVIKVKSKIYYSRKHDTSYLKYKDEKIYPNQTIGISRDEGAATIAGYPHQNKWLFQVIRGNINCYSVYAEKYIEYITHVQKSDEEIFYKLSKADSCQIELYSMMNDNPEAQLKMDKSIRAFKTRKSFVRYGFGSLFGIVGFSALSTVFAPAGILAVGSVILLPSALFIGYPIMLHIPEKRRWEAIKLYNKVK